MASRLFSGCVFVAMLLALGAIFLYAPTEREMGQVQRIFYFHVPAAMTAFVAFSIVFFASIAYLKTRQERWDPIALAAAELGVLFSTINLVTGPLWAKPVWGVYWRWEPRLTTMLITFAMYVAYLMVRAYASGQADQMRRLADRAWDHRVRQHSARTLLGGPLGPGTATASTTGNPDRAGNGTNEISLLPGVRIAFLVPAEVESRAGAFGRGARRIALSPQTVRIVRPGTSLPKASPRTQKGFFDAD